MSPPVLLIEPGAAAAMREEAYYRYPRESGGVILGYADHDDPEVLWVDFELGPGPHAVHERRRFEPDGPWQEEQIAVEYERSGRIVGYLGDWHSHPDGQGEHSRLDRRTLRRIAWSSGARVSRPVMLILAGGPGEWVPWAYRYRRFRLHRLAVEEHVEAGRLQTPSPA